MNKDICYTTVAILLSILLNTTSSGILSYEGKDNLAMCQAFAKNPGILIYIEGEVRISSMTGELAHRNQRIDFEDSLVLYPGSRIVLLFDNNTTDIIGPVKAITLFKLKKFRPKDVP